jgi:hypothetical protein
LEELLKEKDNQVDIARSKLSAVQAQTYSSEGALSSLEEALTDRDKQVSRPWKFFPFCLSLTYNYNLVLNTSRFLKSF